MISEFVDFFSKSEMSWFCLSLDICWIYIPFLNTHAKTHSSSPLNFPTFFNGALAGPLQFIFKHQYSYQNILSVHNLWTVTSKEKNHHLVIPCNSVKGWSNSKNIYARRGPSIGLKLQGSGLLLSQQWLGRAIMNYCYCKGYISTETEICYIKNKVWDCFLKWLELHFVKLLKFVKPAIVLLFMS